MAVGDVKSGAFQIATQNGTNNIQPPAGEEWVIHNLYWNAACTLQIYDSSGTPIWFTFDSDTSQGGRMGTVFHLTNTHYIKVISNYASALYFSYDGIQTK